MGGWLLVRGLFESSLERLILMYTILGMMTVGMLRSWNGYRMGLRIGWG